MKLLSIVFFIILWAGVPLRAAEPTYVYSPDKKFVVAWFDSDVIKAFKESTRSIILQQLPAGDTPFSLVTFPRNTQACWSPDSKKCFIVNAPDNGNVDCWVFIGNDGEIQPHAIPIHPLEKLYKMFAKSIENHPGGQVWRPGFYDATWSDNESLRMIVSDNNGKYRISFHASDPDNEVIEKIPPEP